MQSTSHTLDLLGAYMLQPIFLIKAPSRNSITAEDFIAKCQRIEELIIVILPSYLLKKNGEGGTFKTQTDFTPLRPLLETAAFPHIPSKNNNRREGFGRELI